MEFGQQHPSEDTLEQYLFGSLPEWEVEIVEEHLLVCHSCIDTAEQLVAFVNSIRSTLRHPDKARAAGRSRVLESP